MTFTSGGSKGSGEGSSPKSPPPKRSIGQVIDAIAKWAVLIVGLPIRAAAAIVAQFVANGGAGRSVVGGLLFMMGSAISADSIWQTVFRQRALFPWFESGWSWFNVPATVFNPFFYLAFLIAVGLHVAACKHKHSGLQTRQFSAQINCK